MTKSKPGPKGPHLHGRARRVAIAEVVRYRALLARAIREARIERGIAMSELAAATGLNETNLYHIEGNEHSPTISTLVRIARALDMQPSELVP